MDFFNCLDGLTPREAKILEAARKVFAKHLRRSRIDVLDSPSAVRDYLRFSLGLQQRECFHVTFLCAQNRIIDDEVMFTGTLTQTSVYPREIVKAALARNCAAVIISHNHPSGVAEPSQADRLITDQLRRALNLVDIKVLDHFIIAGDQTLSFAERGLI